MASGSATCVLEICSNLGEGPLWQASEQRLYWVDLLRPAVYRFDPASGRNEQLRADI
jgi:sugar lactone lactonase YvrE